MGKLQSFTIEYDNNAGVAVAGSSLGGKVCLKISQPMKMNAIKITFYGKAKVHWRKTRSGQGSSSNTVHYRAEEVYFNQTIILKSGERGEKFVHPAGTHHYPFNYPLGSALPSSFEGKHGYIRYTCESKVTRAWKFDEKCKRAFTVIRHHDLNSEPRLRNPVQDRKHAVQDCCCCNFGQVKMTVRFDRTGVVPGQSIQINASIENDSSASVGKTSAVLTQKVIFYGRSDNMFSSGNLKGKTVTNTIRVLSKGSCQPNSTQIWDESLCIPPLPPTGLVGCSIINVSYYLEFRTQPEYASSDQMKTGSAIVIGTIPFRTIPQPVPPFSVASPMGFEAESAAIQPPSYQVVMATAPPMDGPPVTMQPTAIPSAPFAEDSPIPPPSYEECIQGHVNIRDEDDTDQTFGQFNFAPVYTYYNWSAHSDQAFSAGPTSTITAQPTTQGTTPAPNQL